MRFALGKVAITRPCLARFENLGESVMAYLNRHISGDWGNLGEEDKAANEQAINRPIRILSRYYLSDGDSIYIITEADRSCTTIMLRDEY
jgi:hypothetical protein